MSLPLTTDQGEILNNPSGQAAYWNNGLSYDVDSRVLTTTVPSPDDHFVAGRRVNVDGRWVVGPGERLARPYVFNAGLPSDARVGRSGVLISQNSTPGQFDPLVAGVCVGPLGGVYTESP